VVYGRAPPALLPALLGSTRVMAVDQQRYDRDIFLTEVCDHLLQVQGIMKMTHDKQHRHLEFKVGDWAWLCLNQHATVSVCDGPQSKLAPKYYGPYQVLERIGSVAYQLQLPQRVRIHDVFHVAFLKKFEGTAPTAIPPLPSIVRGRTVPMPQEVVRAKPTASSWELLVKWVDHASEASWE
jgi:hypothetical protein